MKLDKSPFVIISVIGQELLAQARYVSAVKVLESALKIGTCSLKLRGSVFSALSSAYWALNSLDKVEQLVGWAMFWQELGEKIFFKQNGVTPMIRSMLSSVSLGGI